MANTLHVDVVSAEEQIYSGPAEFVVLPGVMGELGILPRHTPLLTEIRPGAVRIKVPGQEQEEFVFVQGGFLEVQPTIGDGAGRHRDPRQGPGRSQGARRQEGRRGSDGEQDVRARKSPPPRPSSSLALAQIEAIRKMRNRA